MRSRVRTLRPTVRPLSPRGGALDNDVSDTIPVSPCLFYHLVMSLGYGMELLCPEYSRLGTHVECSKSDTGDLLGLVRKGGMDPLSLSQALMLEPWVPV